MAGLEGYDPVSLAGKKSAARAALTHAATHLDSCVAHPEEKTSALARAPGTGRENGTRNLL